MGVITEYRITATQKFPSKSGSVNVDIVDRIRSNYSKDTVIKSWCLEQVRTQHESLRSKKKLGFDFKYPIVIVIFRNNIHYGTFIQEEVKEKPVNYSKTMPVLINGRLYVLVRPKFKTEKKENSLLGDDFNASKYFDTIFYQIRELPKSYSPEIQSAFESNKKRH